MASFELDEREVAFILSVLDNINMKPTHPDAQELCIMVHAIMAKLQPTTEEK